MHKLNELNTFVKQLTGEIFADEKFINFGKELKTLQRTINESALGHSYVINIKPVFAKDGTTVENVGFTLQSFVPNILNSSPQEATTLLEYSTQFPLVKLKNSDNYIHFVQDMKVQLIDTEEPELEFNANPELYLQNLENIFFSLILRNEKMVFNAQTFLQMTD